MRLAGFTRFLGRSSSTCSLSISRIHTDRHIKVTPSTSTSHPDLYPDYGAYSIILPPEPFQFGTYHYSVLPVPPSIPRPQYVVERHPGDSKDRSNAEDPWEGDGRIEMNTDEERSLRKAAAFARDVREFAGKSVKVCFLFPLFFYIILDLNGFSTSSAR